MFDSQVYFSDDGTKMATSIYGRYDINNGPYYNDNRVDLYEFDRCNGSISYRNYYMTPYDTSTYPERDYKMGICFSPNGKLLYLSTRYSIFQIDVEDTNKYNAIYISGPDTLLSNFPRYSLMSCGPDGKLYIGNRNGGSKNMAYIDSPNVRGLGCHFIPQGLWQPYTYLMVPPNMPNYGLGKSPIGGPCWPLGLNPEPSEEEITVYPNPANDILTIQEQESVSEVLLLDMAGRVIKSETALHSNTYTLTVSDIPGGVYLLQVHTQSGTCYYRKVVLE